MFTQIAYQGSRYGLGSVQTGPPPVADVESRAGPYRNIWRSPVLMITNKNIIAAMPTIQNSVCTIEVPTSLERPLG
jgi:hypothetical protein